MHRLVRIVYRDHVLFRYANPTVYEPAVRECVGWIIMEDDETVWLLNDRSISPLPREKINPRECGFVILKCNIIEMKEFG